jgi:ankyrin repeat protein
VDSFIECVGDNDKQAVKLFIEAGFDINTPADSGITALHIAAMKGNTDIVKMLLDKGANPNAAVTSGAEKGSTPLMAAVAGGYVEIVKLLVAKGADVNAKDDHGLTALDYAATEQTGQDIMKVLWDHGAPMVTDAALAKSLEQFQSDLRAKAVRSMTAGESPDGSRKLIGEQLLNFQQQGFTTNQLLEARVSAFNAIWDASVRFVQLGENPDKDREAIKPFVEFCKELQTDPTVQRDLLLTAAGEGDAGRVKWLLDNGADVNVKSESGFTPLTFAIQTDKGGYPVKTVEVLLDAGADCNSKQGPYGTTPTMSAAYLGNTDILKLILSKKPDVNAANATGQTALQIARAANHSEAVVLLKDAGAKE